MSSQETVNKKWKTLFYVGQKFAHVISSKINLSEIQISKLVYEQTSEVMDTDNMYIALYNETSDEVRFPLYFEKGKEINVSPRKTGKGKTEEIIHTRKPIYHPTLTESNEWYNRSGRMNYVGEPLPSWIGVPMMYGNKVLGVIATYHPTQEHVYSKDDLEILETLASQAAIALENSRLYRESKQQAKTLEETNRLLEKANQSLAQHQDITTRALIANDFVHRITNLVGTVPGWADMIKGETGQTEPRMEKIAHWADKIRKDIENLQQSVDKLKEPEHEVQIDIVFIITNMLRQVRIQFRNKISAGQLEIRENTLSTYQVFGLRSALSHAIHGIISNGIEAILETQQQAGILEITTSDYNNSDGEWVKIEVKDTGIGIAKEDLNKIFIPFASTKGRGRGYGLWRSKTVIEDMDGNIKVNSSEGKETVFTILLPKSTKVFDNDY
jgi:signal transduction histidine kinase